MKYYIPFSLKDGNHAIYDILTSIVGAEGFAPTDAAAFTGIEMPRSSPAKFTGCHPLNPYTNRILVYSRMPMLSESGRYASDRENTVYLVVDEKGLLDSVTDCLMAREVQPIDGATISTAQQALFFKDPTVVSLVFMSEAMFAKCEGCKSGVNTKNESAIGYRVINATDMNDSVVVDDGQVDALSDCFSHTDDADYVPTWEREALHGAVLGYKLAREAVDEHRAEVEKEDWQRFLNFKDFIRGLPCLDEDWAGRDVWRSAVEAIRSLPTFLKPEAGFRYFRNDDFEDWDSLHKNLMKRFVRLAVSLKASGWNWSDNECRASLAEAVMNECIYPTLNEDNSDEANEKSVESMSRLMAQVARRFREYNNLDFDLDEKDIRSPFVLAFLKFLQSEGRFDRMAEFMSPSGSLDLETREILAAMYGAFKGYAQMSVKKLSCSSLPDVKSSVGEEHPSRGEKGKKSLGKDTTHEEWDLPEPRNSGWADITSPAADGNGTMFLPGLETPIRRTPSRKGRRTWMTNGVDDELVEKDRIKEFEAMGYKKGRTGKKK